MDLYHYFIFLGGFVSLFHVFRWIWLRIIGPGSPGSVGEFRGDSGRPGGVGGRVWELILGPQNPSPI